VIIDNPAGRTWLDPAVSSPETRSILLQPLPSELALAKLLIEKGLITRGEFMQKISDERAAYQKLLNPTPQ
jgi:hypothetical protein